MLDANSLAIPTALSDRESIRDAEALLKHRTKAKWSFYNNQHRTLKYIKTDEGYKLHVADLRKH
jgi:hypothetical protein